MRLIPKNWTHHHAHRAFHLAMLTHTLLMVGIILSAVCVLSWRAQGVSESVAISAEVEVINDTPAIIESGFSNTFSQPIAPGIVPAPEEVTLDHKEPEVEVIVETNEPEDLAQKESTKLSTIRVPGLGMVPLYHSTAPTFFGRTNIPFAWIYLEIHSVVIKVTTQADAEGYWNWESTEKLDGGLHKMLVTSVDPNNESTRATTRYDFYITVPTELHSAIPQNTPAIGNKGTLFDVFISIPTQFKKIAAGDDVVARIKLVNFGQAGHPVDVGVQYIIEDKDGEVIRQSSETIAVATQISLIKTFVTSSTLPPGTYRFIVRVPSKDIIATAFESFQVMDPEVIPIGNGKLDYTMLFQTLLAMIILFSLISYFEYNKVLALSDRIRRANEFDLASQIK